MNWRKINNIIHRDFGYFFFGMTFIYALSGIALNHIKDWNPSYVITTSEISLETKTELNSLDKESVLNILAGFMNGYEYKSHYYPDSTTLKVFMNNGTLTINTISKSGVLEDVRRRPVFFEVNFLHYNPIIWWTYFSDAYSLALIAIAFTGLFVLKGKKGITGRGAWLTAAGIIIPVVYLLIL
ncbi:MAG: hypothetical protein JW995_05845 [Melioribacteraceae bacterium]|nr:hypothetical protein [Melioribacteraceae bacterium]